jgi:hypothetical protein
MLRHKAAIQCARVAFGFAGIVEEDEWERMKDVTPVSANVEKFVDEEIAHEVLSAAKHTEQAKAAPATVIDHMPVSDVPLYSLSDIYGEVYRTGVPAEEALQEITSQIASYESESVRKAYIDANRGAITALNINTQPAKAA